VKNVPLKYMSVISLGKMLQSTPARADQEVFPYLKASNLTENGLDLSSLQQMPFNRREQEILQLQKDDVVVVEGGSIGRSAWISEDMAGVYFQNSINRVRPKIFADGRYLKYAIESRRASGFFEAITNQATIRHLTADKLANTPVPYLNLERQRKIAEYLDHETAEIDTFIADLHRARELFHERLEAQREKLLMYSLSGRTTQLRHVLQGLKDGTHGTHTRVDNEGEVLLSAKNISSGALIIGPDESRISPSEAAAITRNGYPRRGDVLMIVVGATIGRSALYKEKKPLPFQRSVAFLRPNSKLIDSKYLLHSIRSIQFQEQLKLGAKTAAQPGIYLGDVAACTLSVPNLAEQAQIVDSIDNVANRMSEADMDINRSISLAHERRAALITAAVTGQIDVTAKNKPAAEQLEDDIAQGLHREHA